MANQPKKILLVEDELPLRKVLTDRLSQEGYLVFEAADGAEGYKKALESAPDLILLDIIMPLLDGINMLKKIRKDPVGKKIPVIILTNLNDIDAINQAMEMGVYDYFVKSDWQLEDLVKKVKERLD